MDAMEESSGDGGNDSSYLDYFMLAIPQEVVILGHVLNT